MGRVKLSILSPCYNGEKFIGRYLENILEQSFQNYELIIVNDGSTDKSDEIIKKYKKIFEEKKITFKYLSKLQNEGHARAINDGLKMVDGQYLMWPDIDDYMHQKHATDRKGQKDHQGTTLTKAEAIEKIKSGAFRHVITEIGKLSPKSYLTKYVTVLIWHRPSLNFISTQMNPEELTFRLNIAVMPPMALL